MAALSRGCKPRIDEYLWRAANSTFLLYVIVVSFSLPTMHNISIQTNSYLFGHALAEGNKSKYCPKFPEYNKHPAFAWNWNKDSRRQVNSLWHSTRDKWVWGTPMWRGRLRVRDLTCRFFAYSQNIDFQRASLYHFSLEKFIALLSLVKEVTRSPNRKMIKLLTFDILFSTPRHSRENSY